MIKTLSLKQFRNFLSREFFFHEGINFIIGDNGKGKTNLLESIALISGKSVSGIEFKALCTSEHDFFHIGVSSTTGERALFYNKENNKKNYTLNKKQVSKKKFLFEESKAIVFSPIMMNMMYLSPSLRRDFIDGILINSSPIYAEQHKQYKKILISRNKILKNIAAGQSTKGELNFWDSTFIESAAIIYAYREKLIGFIQTKIPHFSHPLQEKSHGLEFTYLSNITLDGSYKAQLQKLLQENLEKDIILKSSCIGPHRDDFAITLPNGENITNFASRGEIKTLILELKQLEIIFVEKSTKIQPILIVDDLLSELDCNHQVSFLQSLSGYQTFISSILPISHPHSHTIQL